MGVIAFSWALFNIGVWLCHAYLQREPLMSIVIILGIAVVKSSTLSCAPISFVQLEVLTQQGSGFIAGGLTGQMGKHAYDCMHLTACIWSLQP